MWKIIPSSPILNVGYLLTFAATTLRGWCNYAHFMNEETEAQKHQGTHPESPRQVTSPPHSLRREPSSIHSRICVGAIRVPGGSDLLLANKIIQ